jgi:hypothetical protein
MGKKTGKTRRFSAPGSVTPEPNPRIDCKMVNVILTKKEVNRSRGPATDDQAKKRWPSMRYSGHRITVLMNKGNLDQPAKDFPYVVFCRNIENPINSGWVFANSPEHVDAIIKQLVLSLLKTEKQ